jgi:hypothetical protein
MTKTDDGTKPLVPFYAPYVSFAKTLEFLSKNGVPRRLTSRTLRPVLGEEASRVVRGLASLGWIDGDDVPSSDFTYLVAAYGTDFWQTTLREAAKPAYAFIPGDWTDLTPDSLHAAFVARVGRNMPVLRGAETFFLMIANAAGIQLSSKFVNRTARALSPVPASRPMTQTPDLLSPTAKAVLVPTGPENQESKADDDPAMVQIRNLLTLVNAADMTADEKGAVLTVLTYLNRRVGKGKGGPR